MSESSPIRSVRFDRAASTIQIHQLTVSDAAVVAESRFWSAGRRGPAASTDELAEADLSNFVVQALSVGAQAIGTAGGVQQTYDIKDLVTEVSERTLQTSQRASEATDAMIEKATKGLASVSEQTRKAMREVTDGARKDLTAQIESAWRSHSAEVERLVGGENPAFAAKLQPIIDRFGRELFDRSVKHTEELIGKVARQFDPADPASVLAQQARLLGEQHRALVEQVTKDKAELTDKLGELTTAVSVAHAARSAAVATSRLTPLKGDTYAEAVHRQLEAIAAGLGDEYADTSNVAGMVSRCKKGDGLLSIEGGDVRVVIEMSDSGRGNAWGPYLAEAERNRGAVASIGLVRTVDQLNGSSMMTLGPRRIVLAYDPEIDHPDLLRTVVQLSRLAAIAAARNDNSGEIHAAEEKISEALETLTKIDSIDKLASSVSKSAIKIGGEAGALRTELTRLLKQAASALAGAKPEGGASDVAA